MNPLPIGEPVRILKHWHQGFIARVAAHDDKTGFYNVQLLTDADGEEIATEWFSGPYMRRELEPIKTGSEARAAQPYDWDTDVPFFSGGMEAL